VEILPIGYVGELAIGGYQLASGYLNRPNQTAAAFVKHLEHGPMYRTGDKARILPDGTIECLGRIQRGQVKLRGQRVELGEIESAAARTAGCTHTVASIIDNILVVFCLASQEKCSEADVFVVCKKWLAPYMIPNEIVLKDVFPRLPSGKVDRKALEEEYKAIVQSSIQSGKPEDGSSDEFTRAISKIVSGITGVDSVNESSKLAKLGIDSLRAIRLASALRSEGYEINTINILKASTIATLCSTLKKAKTTTEQCSIQGSDYSDLAHSVISSSALSTPKEDIQKILPCTPLQTSMLAETLKDPQAYCNWVELEFAADLTTEAVSTAFERLLKANDILRTGFVMTEYRSIGSAQVVWVDVQGGCIEHVQKFNHGYELDEHALLRPLKIQVLNDNGRCRALIQLHHALYDGWSMDLLVEDLAIVLQNKNLVKRKQFSEVTRFYSSLDRQHLAQDYWEHYLQDFQPSSFPSLSPYRVKPCSLSTAIHTISLTANDIRESLEGRFQPQIILQTALSYLLQVYTGTNDLCYGVVTAGRTIPVAGIENIMGPCIATLPLRVTVSNDSSIGELVSDIHESNRALLEYCTLPLSEIKRRANVDPGQALFDVLFVWQESTVDTSKSDALVKVANSRDFLEFNLVIEIEPTASGLTVKARYRESLIPEPHIQVFLKQLDTLVHHILSSMQRRVGDLASAFTSDMLSIENAAYHHKARRCSLSSYVEAHATSRPTDQAVAVIGLVDGHLTDLESLSYEELNEIANRLAHLLVEEYNVKPNDLVGIFMEKTADLYVSILAVIKARAAYLPLTTSTPQARVESIFTEAQVKVCLSRSDSPDYVKTLRFLKVIEVDDIDLFDSSPDNLDSAYVADDLAYAVFTSGSTGQPKGVLCTQQNLATNIETLAKIYPASSRSKLLQSCNQAFDVSVFEIFFTWFSGMCLYTGTNDVLFRDLEEVIRYTSITHLSLTPTVAALVDPDNVPSVEFLVTAGEAVTELVFRRWAGKGLYQAYGPAECTNVCTCRPAVMVNHAINNIGRPFPNTSAFVIADNDEFNVLPRGAIGELAFGGEQIFRGYLNMPELTRRKVFDHPEYGRVYRSGDIGRILHDGTILIAGRLDDQVKIRGQRIELGEINGVLMSSEHVQDCVTLAVKPGDGSAQKLVSFWVRSRTVKADIAPCELDEIVAAELQRLYGSLVAKLPSYMLPTALVPVTRLPMTNQSKIDKRRLLLLYDDLDASYRSSVSLGDDIDDDNLDRTELETQIAEAVAESKDVELEEIKVNTSFFSLGIDSISAITLARRLRAITGREVAVSTILRYPTITKLAAQLEHSETSTAKGRTLNVSAVFTKDERNNLAQDFGVRGLIIQAILPCTPLQEALLSSSEQYHEVTIFKVNGDIDRLRHAFDMMTQRHGILRTCFVTTTSSRFAFAQVVLKEHALNWNNAQVGDSFESSIKNWTATKSPAVDTFRPPFKITHVEHDGQQHLVFAMHHACYDGEAMAQLLTEIEQSYFDETLPAPITFEPILQEILSADVHRADAYWDRQLRSYVALPFPTLKSNIKPETLNTFVTTSILNLPYSAIREASHKLAVTPLALFKAAWAKLLTIYLGNHDICFGNVVSGRTLAIDGVERLVAPCFNTIPVRIAVSADSTISSTIQNLHRVNVDSLKGQFTPLRRIQSRWSDLGEQLFDTLFILQSPSRKLDDTIWTLEREIGGTGHPVVCEVMPDLEEDVINLNLHFEQSRLDLHSAHSIAEAFDAMVKAFVEQPHATFLGIEASQAQSLVEENHKNQWIGKAPIAISKLHRELEQSLGQDKFLITESLSIGTVDDNVYVILEHGHKTTEILDNIFTIIKTLLPERINFQVIETSQIGSSSTASLSRKAIKELIIDHKRHILHQTSTKAESQVTDDDLEVEIKKVFAQISNVALEQITSNKTIYQLGIDSISAIQVAKLLRNKGHTISAQHVLTNPTATALAKYLRDLRSDGNPADEALFDFESFNSMYKAPLCERYGLKLDDVLMVRPCTALQAGLISQFLQSGGKTYFNHAIYELQPCVDFQEFRSAWQKVVENHEMLRTGFAAVDDAAHPFAMITYASCDTGSYYTVSNGDSEPIAELRKERAKLAQDVLRTLHHPAWYITISQSYFQISAHHALYDAESMRMIMEDVALAYRGEQLNPAPSPNPLISTILRTVRDENREHAQFWKDTLKDVVHNKFPIMTPLHVAERTIQTKKHSSAYMPTDLESGCREHGITLQAALQVAWAELLAAYIGDGEVMFGIVLAGRDSAGADAIAFPSSTTVPYRCIIKDDPRLLLKDAMVFNSSVRNHQHSSLTQIQRWIGQPKTSLFDTIFVFQKAHGAMKDDALFQLVDDEATVEYPVSIEIRPQSSGSLGYQLVFWDDVLPAEQADIMLKQLDVNLGKLLGLATNADTLGSVQLLSHILPKDASIPSECESLHALFEATVDQHPDRIAFEWVPDIDDSTSIQRWTYRKLEDDANRLAHLLTAKGAAPGAMVALCFDKCPQASMTFLAVLKAGCSFVALDPGAPVARKAFVIKDSDAKLLLSMSTLHDALQFGVETIFLDEISMCGLPHHRPSLRVDPQATSYCLYTSGSTGTPKGCLLSHENAVQAILAFQRLFAGRWDEHSRWLQFASFHFDVSVLEMFWTWSVAICLVSAPRDVLFQDLAGSLNKLGITHIDLTPSLARLITPEDVPSLCKGVFITGGEQLKQEILDVWGAEGCIHNSYGPTEATIGCTTAPRVTATGKPSNIGWQFDNVGTYVLKPGTNEIVPRGGVGELCVYGKLVGKGYLNRPEQTEKGFPFVKELGVRIYRTSDLVRLLHNDTFDFLGRSDDQVKLRGQRIELGEINTVIQSVGGVDEVTTQVVKPSQSQGDQLVAFIVNVGNSAQESAGTVLAEQDQCFTDKIKQACQERLPGYMIPTHFVLLNKIPLTVNNKSDTKALREVYHEIIGSVHSGSQKTNSVAMTDQEKTIADILATTFSTASEDMSASSNIYQLGLDSIAVFAFSRALQKAGFQSASPASIMQCSTIRGLAEALLAETSSEEDSVLSAKQLSAAYQQQYRGIAAQLLNTNPACIEDIVPCTALQQGMIARSSDKGDGVYFNTFTYKLWDDIDLERLQSAWAQVQENVAILRTCFIPTSEGYIQVVLRDTNLPYTQEVIAEDTNIDKESCRIKESWIKHNDEALSKPYQIVILHDKDAKYMLFNMFHALYDATSLMLLLQKVSLVYHRQENIEYGPAFHSVLPYGPLKQVENRKAFWLDTLGPASHTPLPAPPNQGKQSISASLILNNLQRLEQVRRQLKISHQALVQTCWMMALQRHLGRPTIIGTVVSGRSIDYPGAELTIGPMFNTIPFYVVIDVRDTWESVAKKCQNFNIAVLPYQHTPLRDTLKWCKKTGNSQLFDTLFVFQKTMDDSNVGNAPWVEIDGEAQADYAISFEAVQSSNDVLELMIVARSGVADIEQCAAILKDFEKMSQALLSDPKASIAEHITWRTNGASTDWTIMQAPSPDKDAHFSWNQEAHAIRNEIAQVANIEPKDIGATTSIFELGLDSIDAIKLSSRLKRHDIQLKVSTIMRQRTIANMSRQLCDTSTTTILDNSTQILNKVEEAVRAQAVEIKLDVSKVKRILPCTPLQEGILADMISSNYKNYFNHDVLLLNQDVDLTKLKQAWQDVVAKSPILRTCFLAIDQPEFDTAFAQLECAEHVIGWSTMKLDADEGFERVYESARLQVSSATVGFVPFMINLVEKKSSAYIVVSMSHALYDGWSIGLLHNDVRKAYLGQLEDRPDHLGSLKNILAEGTSQQAKAFWQSIVSGARVTLMPELTGKVFDDHLTTSRAERESSTNMSDIDKFCREQGVTLQALGQLCWTYVLASYTKSLDIIFGLVLSGRDDEETQEIMFPTMNTVAVRSVIHGTNSEMLKYMQNNLSDIMQHQHFPLRKIKAVAGADRSELFNTLFIYQKIPKTEGKQTVQLYTSTKGSSSVGYPVAVEMEVVDGKLVWRTACKSTYLNLNEAIEMLARLDNTLKHVMESPDAPAVTTTDGEISICRQLPSFIHVDRDDNSRNGQIGDAGIFHETETTWSLTEQAVREALSLMSGIPESDILKDQTIFHIGLDSISAIKVVSYLWKKKSIKINVSTMLKAGSVRGIAATIDKSNSTQNSTDKTHSTTDVLERILSKIPITSILDEHDIAEDNVELVLPASATQAYFLSIWQNSRGELFFPTFHYRVTGASSIADLELAWNKLVARQAVLRTVFVATGRRDVPFLQCVLRTVTDESFNQSGDVANQFRQSCAPVSVTAQQADGYIAVELTIHHALYDAVSLALLMQELQNIYSNNSSANDCSAHDIAALAASQLSSTTNLRQNFWSSYLRNLTTTTSSLSPAWSPHEPRIASYQPAVFDTPSKLNSTLRHHGITFQSLFLATLVHCRHYLTPNIGKQNTDKDKDKDKKAPDDFVVGIYLANRASHPSTTAPTLCIVPLRIRMHDTMDDDNDVLFTTAKQIQADLEKISAREVVGTGLWEIREWTGVSVDCFVNFLMDFSFSSAIDDDDQRFEKSQIADGGVRILSDELANGSEHPSDSEKAHEKNVAKNSMLFQTPQTLQANTVLDSYPPSIDIEAAVRNDALDIGVFGPASLVSKESAESFVSEMCRLLGSLASTLSPTMVPSNTQPQTKKKEVQDIEECSEEYYKNGAVPTDVVAVKVEVEEANDSEDFEEVEGHEVVELQSRLRIRRNRPIWPRPVSVLFGGWRWH